MNMTMHGLGYPADPLAEQWQVPIQTMIEFSQPLLSILGLRALWLRGLRLLQWLWSHSRGGTGLVQIPIYLGEAPFFKCVGSIWALPK